jgi:hypothetical protein
MVLAGGLALLLAGCGNDSVLGVDGGRVRFVLSADAAPATSGAALVAASPTDGDDGDRPRRFFQAANITLSSILARNQDGVLVNVEMDLPVTVDVMMLEDGREVTLPDGELPVATYDQVVLVMTQVEGVTHDGTTITITPSGGGWTTIVPICPFVVEDGGTTTVSLTFMLNRAFSWHSSRYHFEPRLVCDEG